MSGRNRTLAAALFLCAVLGAVVLVAFAGNACPGPTATDACPAANVNRTVVVGLAAGVGGLLITPFAFLAEFVLRRRIVYRGAWGRAARRGLLVAAVIAALAALRLGDALTVPVAIFTVILAGIVEWLAVRRFDLP